jgi:hypothetical protein
MAFYDEWIRYVKSWWLIGVIVGVLSLALSYVVKALGFSAVVSSSFVSATFAAQPPEIAVRPLLQQGISPEIGNWLFDFFRGYVGFGIPAIIAVLLSAIALVIVGRIAYSYIPYGRVQWQKLAAVLFYGAVLLGAIMVFGWPFSLAVLVALAIYYVILAIATWYVLKLLGMELPN